MILLLPLGKAVAGFGDIQKISHLVGFQPNDGFLVNLRRIHQGGGVVFDQLLTVIILKK